MCYLFTPSRLPGSKEVLIISVLVVCVLRPRSSVIQVSFLLELFYFPSSYCLPTGDSFHTEHPTEAVKMLTGHPRMKPSGFHVEKQFPTEHHD